VLSKAAQIGGTTWAILRAIHACLSGLNVIYFFPTRTDVLEFSKSRVRPLLADNPFLNTLMSDTDTAGLKRIGDANLLFRGMQSTVGMKSVPADMVVFDELDEASPDARSLALERLSHSEYKRIIELSNPSLPDYGIDESFQRSDQRHWTVKCGTCNAWVDLVREFPAKVGQDVRIILPRGNGSFYRACPACAAELDVSAGEWVAEYPSRSIHGYRISQLFSPTVDPGEILREYQTTRFPDRFYNLKIGIAWADIERRLDIASVLALCTDAPMAEGAAGGTRTLMGVDTGRDLHVVVLRSTAERHHHALVHLGVCRDFGELDGLMARFGVQHCVIDGLPETHATREFAIRQGSRVSMNFFVSHQRGGPLFDRQRRMVQVNRTDALDASRAIVREKRLALPRRSPLVQELAEHMAADAKILDEDPETGEKRFKYVRTGPDHYSLALTYALLATHAPHYQFGVLRA